MNNPDHNTKSVFLVYVTPEKDCPPAVTNYYRKHWL